MRFYDKRFRIYKDWITLIPTIDIHINAYMQSHRKVRTKNDNTYSKNIKNIC
jgi:hypothetical protein